MKTESKKVIIILLISAFLIPILSMPLLALAQQCPEGQLQDGKGGCRQGCPAQAKWDGSQCVDVDTGKPIQGQQTPAGQTAQTKTNPSVSNIITGFFSGALLFAAGIIGKVLGFLFSWIIYFEAWILDTAISGFNITNSQIVKIGWGATRDLANMTFILALIIIAISTILRVTSFAAKQMFWRVIVAALLVNFSLVFGGVVIDASQMLAKFFVNAATGNDPAQFSIRLANAMDITAFYNPGTGSFSGTVFKAVNQIWVAPAGIILGLVALVIMVFVFGAAAFFMLVRVIWLWILLILAPFAWAALAFPGQSKYFSEWWRKLIDWAFFAPVFTFFMWLSLQLFAENGRLNPGVFSAVAPALGNKSIAYVEASAPEAIMQFGLMAGLMVASLIVAQKFGVYGAKVAIGATKGAARSTALWGIRQYGRAATALGTAAAGVGAARSPAVRTITAPIRGVGTGLRALGGVATGARGGRITAPLRNIPNNPLKAVSQGAMAGSGLFKKTTNVYECQNCNNAIQSKQTPTINCPTCGATATLIPGTPHANWQHI